MKTDKISLKYRIALISVCVIVAGGCLYAVSRTYDPLARYPYATSENRDLILNYLDEDDIDYIITSQMEPDEFIPFISQPEFDIHNARMYTQAMAVQQESPAAIVHFVNTYKDQLKEAGLKELLTNWSYQDLAAWYDLGSEDVLITNPGDINAMPGIGNSVWRYVPANLKRIGDIYLASEAAEAFEKMADDYGKVMETDPLKAVIGYLSYEDAQKLYEKYPDFVLPAGENELQLGYSVGLEGIEGWIASDGREVLSEKQQEMIDWLKENAWRYGFIIRYPEGRENETGHKYDPCLLRYVGREKARTLYESGKSLEQLS